jgi:hypothetical protein
MKGEKVRGVLLIDKELKLRNWQMEALRLAVASGLCISTIYINTLENNPKEYRKHFFYYAFIASFRFKLKVLKKEKIDLEMLGNPKIVKFAYQPNGKWRTFPVDYWQEIDEIDFVIKFDSALLRNMELLPIKFGVLSYHHGDPEIFRGRPVGFWEMFYQVTQIGVGVQLISDKLDAGKFLCSASAKISQFSYSRSVENAYAAGVPLLTQAIRKIQIDGKAVNSGISPHGKVYSLPNNIVVCKFWAKILARLLVKLYYGLFVEKRWWIGEKRDLNFISGENTLLSESFHKLSGPQSARFIADPMYSHNHGIFCEVMKRPRFKGQIWQYHQNRWKRVKLDTKHHFSYPQVLPNSNRVQIIPESSQYTSPRIYTLHSETLSVIGEKNLKGLEKHRMLDATLFENNEVWYLFGNSNVDNFESLRLWSSTSLDSEFIEHPNSPISTDIGNLRMAGPLFLQDDALLRFGQNNTKGYGRSVTIMKVIRLTPYQYSEEPFGEIKFGDSFGPHTISHSDRAFLLDGYSERFSPFAWLRRLLARA